ncbi:hypothetical protein ACIBHY_43055 [Nonomuraea sp. NPDC050547]|uniref:hypothetical protein n=1 Tax=Nonomuraea sp. NPDC050547 TaxID=3364368 RepID=UPI00378E714B
MRRLTGTIVATAVITVTSWAAPPVDAHTAGRYGDAAAATSSTQGEAERRQ